MIKNATTQYNFSNEKERRTRILTLFRKFYPQAKIALNYSSAWELLVAVILSAQCTDVVVNKVTGSLFKKYRILKDYVKADLSQFETDIRPTGFFRNKARYIIDCAIIITDKFEGKIPQTMSGLLTLPGVARKTANIVLSNAYGVIAGIAVDTHVARISQRLRLIKIDQIGGKNKITFKINGQEYLDFFKNADTDKIETGLMDIVPKSDWADISYRIIDHGRAICKAQNPKCETCQLREFCPSNR